MGVMKGEGRWRRGEGGGGLGVGDATGDATGRGGALPVQLLAALLEGGHHLLDHLVEEHGGELVVQRGAEAEFHLELEPAGSGAGAALEVPVALELLEHGGIDGLHRDGSGPRQLY